MKHFDDGDTLTKARRTADAGNVTPLPTPQKKKRRGHRRLLAFAVLTVFALALALNWDKISPAAVIVSTQAFFGEFGESKFPVQYSQGSFRGAAPISGDIAVVTDTGFLVYTSTGRQIAGRQHGLNSPRIATNAGHAVIYEAGGKQLCSETRFSQPFTQTMDFPITTASVNRSGYVAVATGSNNYLSEMTVFNPSGTQVFKWYCKEGRILSLDVSPDGTRAAASVVLSEGGDIKSLLYVYDLSQKDPVAVLPYPGTLLFSVTYRSGNRILALGDDKTICLSGVGKQLAVYPYGDRSLKCFDANASATLLVFSRYGVGKESTIVSLNANGGVASQADVDENIKLIAGGGSAVALTTTGLRFFDSSLKQTGTSAATGDINELLSLGNYAYSFTPATAYQYKAG